MASKPTRWGILGTGNIAHAFVLGLKDLPDAEIAAVGSRTMANAQAFAQQHHIRRVHDSYASLAADPTIDVIYVATPHSLHAENCLLCLEHGKAVLCEKPFSLNAQQAAEVFAFARQKGLFVMEAMWTRFQPGLQKLRDLLVSGAIGKPQLLQADFGFRAKYDPHSRLFDPVLGGGALLDIGIYPISLAHFLFGNPVRVTGLAHLGQTGVDESCGAVLQFAGGELAVVHASLRINSPTQALVLGTAGRIKLHSPIYRPPALTLWRTPDPDRNGALQRGQQHFKNWGKQFVSLQRLYYKVQKLNPFQLNGGGTYITTPYKSNGYQYQASEVHRCLQAGLLESPQMSAQATIELQTIMDSLRQQWGMAYPQERFNSDQSGK